MLSTEYLNNFLIVDISNASLNHILCFYSDTSIRNVIENDDINDIIEHSYRK